MLLGDLAYQPPEMAASLLGESDDYLLHGKQ
jgi:hypothetical protein